MEKNLLNLNENGKKALKFRKKKIATRTDNENKKITFFDKKLDKYQKQAVRRAVNSNDFFLNSWSIWYWKNNNNY